MRRRVEAQEGARLSLPQLRQAAVLLPLLDSPEGVQVLFTVRAEGLKSHAGQIAFPGGRCDPGERPEDAARRESLEEIGLLTPKEALWGRLDDQLSPFGFVVTPVVACLAWPQRLTLCAGEVAEVFTAPLLELRGLTPTSQTRQVYGLTRTIYYYAWGERLIWGMTANVLKNFMDLTAPKMDCTQD